MPLLCLTLLPQWARSQALTEYLGLFHFAQLDQLAFSKNFTK